MNLKSGPFNGLIWCLLTGVQKNPKFCCYGNETAGDRKVTFGCQAGTYFLTVVTLKPMAKYVCFVFFLI